MLQVLGRSTSDVELKKSKKDKNYARATIAVNHTKKGEKDEEKTYFYDVLLFGKSAENATKLIKKGDLVFTYGRPDFDAYLSKDKKEPKPSLTLIADNWQVIK